MLKTFPVGGVHPPENKITAGLQIQVLPLPQSVIIPVAQHIGAPASVIVSKGDLVKTGQVIAQGKGFVSTNIHSSVSGKVNKIDVVLDSTGYRQPAVYIDVEGDDWTDTIDRSNEIVTDIRLSPEEIIKRCLDSGIAASASPKPCRAEARPTGVPKPCRAEARPTGA